MADIEMSEKTRQARDRLRQTLKENPDLAKAFKETLEELRKPENVKAMAKDLCKGIEVINKLRDHATNRR